MRDFDVGLRYERLSEEDLKKLRKSKLLKDSTFLTEGKDKLDVFLFRKTWVVVCYLEPGFSESRMTSYKICRVNVFNMNFTKGILIGSFPLQIKTKKEDGLGDLLAKQSMDGVFLTGRTVCFPISRKEKLKEGIFKSLDPEEWNFSIPRGYQLR